jgi:hypothetical protein
MLRPTLAFAALAGLAAGASADVVHLKNGRKLEGKAERREDGTLLLRTLHGTARLAAAEVARVEPKRHLIDEHAERAAAVDVADAAGQLALARWCLEHEWRAQAQVHAQYVVEVEPHNVAARTILDHTLLDGRWMPRAEALRAQGLVQYRGKWMSEADAAAAHAKDLEADQRVRTQALVDHIVRTMSRADAAGRRLCYDELCRLADQTETPGLKQSAQQVYDHYERVAAASQSAGSGVVITELRLTNAQLVRPIPVLTTNLGQALSTPVTIQLPELKIEGIQTTVAIPFGLPK